MIKKPSIPLVHEITQGLIYGFMLLLAACISHPTAPVTDLSPVNKQLSTYTVKKGDTLHAISFRTGMAYQKLAQINGLSEPYKIYVGDVLNLRSTGPTKSALKKPSPLKSKSVNKLASPPLLEMKLPVSVARWQWPAKGKLTQTFSKTKARYGIQISANRATPVVSSASGQVVYVGNGIKGYGELVIVKHSANLVSAYAHNEAILVNEGDQINAGEQLARMGSSGTKGVKLHFEIRKNGEPVNPLKYLPLKRG